jgi:enoyl-CoA hydratase
VAEATELATRLGDLPRHAVAAARRLINAPLEAAAAAQLDACSAAETECFDSEEHRSRLDELIQKVAEPARATDRQ